jgi:hypothetical protein
VLAGTALAQPPWVEEGMGGARRVHVYFFWSQHCPHCEAAHSFIESIPRERPWVELHMLEVSRSEENARRFKVGIALAVTFLAARFTRGSG